MAEENTPGKESVAPKSDRKPLLLLGGLAVLGILGFTLFGRDSFPRGTTVTETAAEAERVDLVPLDSAEVEESPSGELTEGEIRIVSVEAGSFFYKPNEIRVKKGETVRIILTAKDLMHDFNIDELEVKIPVTQSGNTAEFEFTADVAGTFEYYCSVGKHRSLGQVGKLIVE